MNARLLLALVITVLVLLCVSLALLRHLEDISMSSVAREPATASKMNDERPVVRIGVISRFAPNIIYSGYQPIMDHLSREGTHRYELTLSSSYQDAVERLQADEVQASFLGSWIFGHLESAPDLVPLVAPLNAHGQSEFHAVLVARADTDVDSIADLKGLRVAVPSARSWSGNWLQVRGLATAGLSVDDLEVIRHFDHHQTVAWKVLRGEYDVGVVKESVAEAFQDEGLKEVARSTPIPGPPLVATTHCPASVRDEIRRILLALDADSPADRALMATWSPEFAHGFTSVDRQRYSDTLGILPEVAR